MSEKDVRPVWQVALRGVLRFVVAIGVVIYTILDELLFPLVRPLIAWLGRLRVFERLGTLIGRSPPYAVLLLLAVPFVIIEPAKVYALYLFATGHLLSGVVLLIVAQILSLLICERIYHAGHAPLMRIGWFRMLMGWIIALRDKALGLIRATSAWRAAVRMIRSVRSWFRGLLASFR
jgi:hypothetical protein